MIIFYNSIIKYDNIFTIILRNLMLWVTHLGLFKKRINKRFDIKKGWIHLKNKNFIICDLIFFFYL